MIIVMDPDATEEQVAAVVARVEGLGFRAHRSGGSERTLVGVIGDERPVDPQTFEALPGVERALPILHPFKLASRDFHPADRVVPIRDGVRLGGPEVVLMAGPCAVEGREQLEAAAEAVAAQGARVLRGGAFKPRTSPYSFQGLGAPGLAMLREVADALDMAVVTEVLQPQDVPLVAEHADVIQIGARNMANFSLLRAVAVAGRPVLLKRGLGATVDELLLAAEYLLDRGNEHVAVCERGIRTFEPSTRFTLDINAVPVLKQLSSLPVVVDPSHATGRAALVGAAARAAVAAGADGLLIEVHPDPGRALSDGAQSLSPAMFAEVAAGVRAVAAAVGRRVA